MSATGCANRSDCNIRLSNVTITELAADGSKTKLEALNFWNEHLINKGTGGGRAYSI